MGIDKKKNVIPTSTKCMNINLNAPACSNTLTGFTVPLTIAVHRQVHCECSIRYTAHGTIITKKVIPTQRNIGAGS